MQGCSSTESEWEYVCRAGTRSKYNIGDKLTIKQANFDNKIGKTSVVGTYNPNNWNLYDMHGNVFEWCYDFYNKRYYKECQNAGILLNPRNIKGKLYRVIKLWSFPLLFEISMLYSEPINRCAYSFSYSTF